MRSLISCVERLGIVTVGETTMPRQIQGVHHHPMHTDRFQETLKLGKILRRVRFERWDVIGKDGTIHLTLRGNRHDVVRYARKRLGSEFLGVQPAADF